MKQLALYGNAKTVGAYLQAERGTLADDSREISTGERERLVRQIEETDGVTRAEAEVQVSTFEEQFKALFANAGN